MALSVRWLQARNLLSNPLRRAWLASTRARDPGPRVVANSVPKAGTYLLERCLAQLPGLVAFHQGVFVYGLAGRKGLRRRLPALRRMGGGTYVLGHLGCGEEERRLLGELGVRHVFILRDPRDVVVSHALFSATYPHLPQYPYYASLPDAEARLRATVVGGEGSGLDPLDVHWRRYADWLRHCACVVRFEELVGSRGGGDDEAQRAAVARIAGYLGIDLSAEALDRVAAQVYSPSSRTFRRGRIGDWREHFSPGLKALFKAQTGDLLQRLGYEEDGAW